MKQYLITFWLRLRFRYEYPKCRRCRRLGTRNQMIKSDYGIFCTSYCMEEYEEITQSFSF